MRFHAIALFLLITGCAASSEYMRPGPAAMAPRLGYAKIFFIRPSSFARVVKFTVIDHQGRFIGDSLPTSHFAVQVPAGRHVFIVWAENTAALQAQVSAGCTYFVEVSSKMGALSARGHLIAITPRSEKWASRDEWLQDTDVFTPNQAAGQAYLNSRAEDLSERVRRGLEHLRNYDQQELAERTIQPADGICPRPIAPAPQPAPAP